jgi:hypothetical protein
VLRGGSWDVNYRDYSLSPVRNNEPDGTKGHWRDLAWLDGSVPGGEPRATGVHHRIMESLRRCERNLG